MGFVVGGASRQ